MGLQFRQHGLQPLFKVAAIAGTGQQRAHIEGEDRGAFQHGRHIAIDDALRKALGNGRLADTGFSDIERVILRPPAQDLDGAFDLEVAPDQRVHLAVAGLLVEVDAIGVQRLVGLAALLAAFLLAPGFGGILGLGAGNGPRLAALGRLGDAVRDVVDRVEAGHVLLLQEKDRMAFAFGEQRHQHVRTADFFAA